MFVKLSAAVLGASIATTVYAAPAFQVYVSNEKSGDVTVIDGTNFRCAGDHLRGQAPRAAFTRVTMEKRCTSR